MIQVEMACDSVVYFGCTTVFKYAILPSTEGGAHTQLHKCVTSIQCL